MPRLLIEKGPDRGKNLTLKVGDQAVVGRDAQANLQLSDVMCSRKHFLVASKGSVFGLKDLGSANGTQVNGKTAEGPVKLAHGDMIQCGETLISWLADDSDNRQGGLIGQQIGGYRIEQRLGRGAMGTVYKAIQLSLGRVVALKVLSPELVKDSKFCEMFLKEARAAGGLNHPNIIQVYDVGEASGQYYFSMEFAAKGSVLDQLNAQKRVEVPRAVVIVKDACRALDYAERKSLVHRDIKPDNLMVMEDEAVKLGDLGLAMSAQELQGEQAGVFGTPHYIAPEQAMGKPIDHRADIYALGASFYRILTGNTLFTGQTVKEILKKQVRDAHPPITTHMPDCPPAIATIIDKMLAKNPAERYQHAGDVLNDLENWQSLSAKRGRPESTAFGRTVKGPGAEIQEQIVASAQRRNLMVAIIFAILGVSALVVTIWAFAFRDDGAANANGGANAPITPSNTPAANTQTGPELTEAQKAANVKVHEAMILAKRDAQEMKLQQAISGLEKAIAENSASTLIGEAKKLIEQYKAQLAEESNSINDMRDEWATVLREKAAKIEEWKFKEAEEILKAFWTKYDGVTNEEKKKIWVESDDAVRLHFWKEIDAKITKLGTDLDKQTGAAITETNLDKRLEMLDGAQKAVQTAYDACDHEDSRKKIKKHLDRINDLLGIAKKNIEDAKRREVEKAAADTEAAIIELCAVINGDIGRGDFNSPFTRLDNFEKNDKTYNLYKSDSRLQNATNMLKLRREQTRLELDSLRALGSGSKAVLPSTVRQSQVLAQKPWPKAAQDLLGAKDARFRLDVANDATESQWTITVFVGASKSDWTASEFAPGRSRDANGLACALAHLAANDDSFRQALMQPVSGAKGDLPLFAGVFAWLAELGAAGEYFPVMESCYAALPASDASHAVVREYMAYALKMAARTEFDKGNTARADELIKRLYSDEFKGTRVREGK